MRRPSMLLFAAALLSAATVATLRAQERIDQDVSWRIRQEGTARSQIMETLHVLTDVYGPRLAGSPNIEKAGQWAVKEMQGWGLTSVAMEPWAADASGGIRSAAGTDAWGRCLKREAPTRRDGRAGAVKNGRGSAALV